MTTPADGFNARNAATDSRPASPRSCVAFLAYAGVSIIVYTWQDYGNAVVGVAFQKWLVCRLINGKVELLC